MSGWHIVDGSEISEPVSDNQLTDLAKVGYITGETQLSHPNKTRGKVVRAYNIRALRQYFVTPDKIPPRVDAYQPEMFVPLSWSEAYSASGSESLWWAKTLAALVLGIVAALGVLFLAGVLVVPFGPNIASGIMILVRVMFVITIMLGVPAAGIFAYNADQASRMAQRKYYDEFFRTSLLNAVEYLSQHPTNVDCQRQIAICAKRSTGLARLAYDSVLATLSEVGNVPSVKILAVEVGRIKSNVLRGGSVTVYDENAIQNDISARISDANTRDNS